MTSGHDTSVIPPEHVTDISKVSVTSTDTEEVTITCSDCVKVTTVTITKCSDGGCHVETVTVSNTKTVQVTTSCSECAKDKVTTTVRKCSDGGCNLETVTLGDKKTVVVTVNTCTNGACTPIVTLVVEELHTSVVNGKTQVYTTTTSIPVSKSRSESSSASRTGSSAPVSTLPSKASHLVDLMASLILFFTSWLVVF